MISETMMIERAKNAAANGRAFCLALAAICIAVYVVTRESMYVPLAVVAALPVGLSHIIDNWQVTGFIGLVARAFNVIIPLIVMVILFAV